MSVTARSFKITGASVLRPDPIAYGTVEGDRTTITSITFNQTSGFFPGGYQVDSFPKTTVIDGVTYRWTINETAEDGIMEKVTFVKRATLNIGTRLTINKPFFQIPWGENNENKQTFSFYDLGYLTLGSYGQGLSGTMELDGKTPFPIDIQNGSGSGVASMNTVLSADALYRFTWSIGAKSYTMERRISAGQTQLTATYTPPASWCEEMPAATYGVLTAKIEVIFGTQVYQYVNDTVQVHVPDDFIPVINSIQVADTKGRVPAAWGMFVQDNSNICMKALDVTPAHGAQILQVMMQVQGFAYLGTMQNLPTSNTITQYGIIDVEVTVMDQRSRRASKTARVTVVEYRPPQLSVNSTRCDEHGSVENEGTYFLAETATAFSSCNGKNALSLSVKYKITSDPDFTGPAKVLTPGSSSAVCGGDLDTEFSYDVEYTLTDALNTIKVIDFVSTGVYCIHFLHGGRGVAFGSKATRENYADFAFDAIFRGKTTFTKDNGEEVTIQQIIEKLGL